MPSPKIQPPRPSIQDLLDEAKREVRMRKTVYPGLIANGKLNQRVADRSIRNMEAIHNLLLELRDAQPGRLF